MSPSRDRRERPPVDFDPEEHEGPACQPALKERDPKPRWIMRLAQPVPVVSPVLEGGPTAGARRAWIARPPQEAALARRGSTCGLEGVARRGGTARPRPLVQHHASRPTRACLAPLERTPRGGLAGRGCSRVGDPGSSSRSRPDRAVKPGGPQGPVPGGGTPAKKAMNRVTGGELEVQDGSEWPRRLYPGPPVTWRHGLKRGGLEEDRASASSGLRTSRGVEPCRGRDPPCRRRWVRLMSGKRGRHRSGPQTARARARDTRRAAGAARSSGTRHQRAAQQRRGWRPLVARCDRSGAPRGRLPWRRQDGNGRSSGRGWRPRGNGAGPPLHQPC